MLAGHATFDTNTFTTCARFVQVPGKNYIGVYRYVGLGAWLLISAFMVLDRFYWNVWPRQSICTDGCGGDFFCDMADVSLRKGRSTLSGSFGTRRTRFHK